jgi:hypothetical protein
MVLTMFGMKLKLKSEIDGKWNCFRGFLAVKTRVRLNELRGVWGTYNLRKFCCCNLVAVQDG